MEKHTVFGILSLIIVGIVFASCATMTDRELAAQKSHFKKSGRMPAEAHHKVVNERFDIKDK